MTVDSVIVSFLGEEDFSEYEHDVYQKYQEKAEQEIIKKLSALLSSAIFLAFLKQWGTKCACSYKEHRDITIRLKSGKTWKISSLFFFGLSQKVNVGENPNNKKAE